MAAAAFVLSVLALVVNVSMTWLRWPRIVVDITGRKSVVVTPGSNKGGEFDEIAIAVVNSGAEAITVRTIGLAVVKEPDGTKKNPPNVMLDYESARFLKNPPLPEGPELPTRVEAHDVKVWTYPNHHLGVIPVNCEMIAYADRYKAFRFWPHWGRPLVKRRTSQRTAFRTVDHVRRQPGRVEPPTDSEGGPRGADRA